jgi:hypothetical protein
MQPILLPSGDERMFVHVSVARRESVAKLDEFIGPKP